MRILLEDSAARKLGAWCLLSAEEGDLAVFKVKPAAELSDEDMRSLIKLVTEVADEMEDRLTGTDDLRSRATCGRSQPCREFEPRNGRAANFL